MSKEFVSFMRRRVSAATLDIPAPNKAEWRTILDAASRAADHGNLKPWRFRVYQGEARAQIGEIYWQHAKAEVPELPEDKKAGFVKKAYRAPAILMVYANVVEHPKVPRDEQIMATAAAAQQALLGLDAYGFGGIWRTGPACFTEQTKQLLGLAPNEEVVGLIYCGTPTQDLVYVGDTGIDDRLTFVDE
ncbi:nitroreductase [Maribrevibacterium harenarium]|uniref:Putative NAD(P)H nitroreductase n=1 Tax=Maribrevibacterium harenarium TaxID=2589817 RepID=A0A501X535_9GAMM|nr:nitroreductase [Maribrevibacterium harenarium]TPE55517.1 nitroreductase [Maribrevibacterium harenarium]